MIKYAPTTLDAKLQTAFFYLGVIFMAVGISALTANIPGIQNLVRSGTIKIISVVSLFVLVFCIVLHLTFPKKLETSLLLLISKTQI